MNNKIFKRIVLKKKLVVIVKIKIHKIKNKYCNKNWETLKRSLK
jgi:hypothetical protein